MGCGCRPMRVGKCAGAVSSAALKFSATVHHTEAIGSFERVSKQQSSSFEKYFEWQRLDWSWIVSLKTTQENGVQGIDLGSCCSFPRKRGWCSV